MKYGQHYYSVITADMRAYVLFLIINYVFMCFIVECFNCSKIINFFVCLNDQSLFSALYRIFAV